MAQIFRSRSNTIARASLAVIVLLIGAGVWVVHAVYWSPWTTLKMIPLAGVGFLWLFLMFVLMFSDYLTRP
jgi:hypothetical protein